MNTLDDLSKSGLVALTKSGMGCAVHALYGTCKALSSTVPMPCETQVIDEVEDYLKLLKSIYSFKALAELLRRPDFSFVFDGMHGVAGPYAKRIFVQVHAHQHASAAFLSCIRRPCVPCPALNKAAR